MAKPKDEKIKKFIEMEGKLERLLVGQSLANSEDVGQRNSYRTIAAQANLDYMVGAPQIVEDTPQGVIDRVYGATIPAQRDKNKGYFTEFRKEVIQEAPLEKLAKSVLEVHPVKVKGKDKHNEVVDLIQQYAVVHTKNRAFANDLPIDNQGTKVKESDLQEIAEKYLIGVMTKKLDVETDPDNKYLTPETKKGLIAASLALMRTTRSGALMVTKRMEKELEQQYLAILKTDEQKAAYVRDCLMHNEDIETARGDLYRIMKSK